MEEKDEYELVVSQGKRPIWMIIMAAISFTYAIYLVFNCMLTFYNYGWNEQTFLFSIRSSEPLIYSIVSGITFSLIKTVLIDIDKEKLISRFSVGPFSRDIVSKIPELNYVSVFLDSKGFYQVNLWYKGNKHYKMFTFEEKEPAFKFAAQSAIKLNTDLLDATKKGDFKRINKLSVPS